VMYRTFCILEEYFLSPWVFEKHIETAPFFCTLYLLGAKVV
jgi:hypothetical protein